MQYISSDTNVWIDFAVIDRLALPFLLPYRFIMNRDAVEAELLIPKDLGPKLLALGLESVELSEEEFYLALTYREEYIKLSVHDCVALAIAKTRGIILLSGDGALRKAACKEQVSVLGTIGILDQLLDQDLIDAKEYRACFANLLAENGKKVRLPRAELEKRIKKMDGKAND